MYSPDAELGAVMVARVQTLGVAVNLLGESGIRPDPVLVVATAEELWKWVVFEDGDSAAPRGR